MPSPNRIAWWLKFSASKLCSVNLNVLRYLINLQRSLPMLETGVCTSAPYRICLFNIDFILLTQ